MWPELIICGHLTQDTDPCVQAVVARVEGVAAVWAGHAAPPRLLLGVGQDVRLQVGRLSELLVATLKTKELQLDSDIRKQ